MFKNILLLSSMLILLSSCATMTPEKAASWDSQTLCDTLAISRQYGDIKFNPNAQMIISELEVRNDFTFKEMEAIKKGEIYIGMKLAPMYCSWGTPENTSLSTGSWGTSTQHIYSIGTYVYTENGKVTSWQM
ncbi:hypothetical protein AN944_02635 [Shewanella sp. P1-14-1]|uniref:hypothetical protein n=1 Tax=Shewanella sp. P1-14-1 TaxID=1723761 RepID=UPI0006D682B8|nr:hypothetical protein [Shewanella sp. P1-14-1]KPZ69939.1 hypothetical protein AN944_02635 [Shewanella sp. P1-14-1]